MSSQGLHAQKGCESASHNSNPGIQVRLWKMLFLYCYYKYRAVSSKSLQIMGNIETQRKLAKSDQPSYCVVKYVTVEQ